MLLGLVESLINQMPIWLQWLLWLVVVFGALYSIGKQRAIFFVAGLGLIFPAVQAYYVALETSADPRLMAVTALAFYSVLVYLVFKILLHKWVVSRLRTVFFVIDFVGPIIVANYSASKVISLLNGNALSAAIIYFATLFFSFEIGRRRLQQTWSMNNPPRVSARKYAFPISAVLFLVLFSFEITDVFARESQGNLRNYTGIGDLIKTAHLRSLPTKNSASLGLVSSGSSVQITAVTGNGEWYQVVVQNRKGYIYRPLVAIWE